MSDALGFDPHPIDDTPMRAALAFADGLAKTLRIARALLQSGRSIDLAGLDLMIGLLCARVLDLPPEHGRAVRPELISLRIETDALIALLATVERQPTEHQQADQSSRSETDMEY